TWARIPASGLTSTRQTSPTATSSDVASTTCPITRVTRPWTAKRGIASAVATGSTTDQSVIQGSKGDIGAAVNQPLRARQGGAAPPARRIGDPVNGERASVRLAEVEVIA